MRYVFARCWAASRTAEMKAITATARLVLICSLLSIQVFSQSVDLTLTPASSGSDVVAACVSLITQSQIFPADNGILRRIAYVETHDGTDGDTYPSNYHGGIWNIDQTKFMETQNVAADATLQTYVEAISTELGIDWTSAQWVDLRKPLYSAIGASLALVSITATIPLVTDISGQASYWVSYYTSSQGTVQDFIDDINYLNSIEGRLARINAFELLPTSQSFPSSIPFRFFALFYAILSPHCMHAECNVNGLDLYFVMDESGSVSLSNYQLMKDFVYDIADSFTIGEDDVRIGVLTFGSNYRFQLLLNTYYSKSSVLSAITNLQYAGTGTNTAAALDALREQGYTSANGGRPLSEGIPRVAVVITDGFSNNRAATITAAQNVHDAGIIGFAIGISGADVTELNAIASDPSYVAFISSFDSTLLSALQVQISNQACVGKLEKTSQA